MPSSEWQPEASPSYWAGHLSEALRGALATYEQEGHPGVRNLRRTLAEYEASPVHRPREIVGLAIVDATGDCYAIVTDHLEAVKAKGQAELYLFEAESCGHPRAASWVAKRLPIQTLSVDADERDELLEAGTPILEREG